MKLAMRNWEAGLAPELGGAVTYLRRDGIDILRPAPPGATEPFLLGSFAMVPYANRIAEGRFEFDGARHRLAPNHAGQPHPLHGVSWLRRWTVIDAKADRAILVHDHLADEAWPWAYRAEQRISLDTRGLTVDLGLTNTDARAMPVSLGFHPYFSLTGVTSLRFVAARMWQRDDELLPTTPDRPDALGDWTAGAQVIGGPLIDNSYSGWEGNAWISRSEGDVLLTGAGTSVLHLYTPPGEDYFCAEPATAIPDTFNRSTPIVLQPDEHHRIAMTILTA